MGESVPSAPDSYSIVVTAPVEPSICTVSTPSRKPDRLTQLRELRGDVGMPELGSQLHAPTVSREGHGSLPG